jgi:hypothetical protein
MARPSEAFRSQQGGDEVDQKADGGQESDEEFRRHRSSLDPVAAGDVRGRKNEEQPCQGNEGDVGHLVAPCCAANMSPA